MLTKPMLSVTFLLVTVSLCVESIKTAGSNFHQIGDFSLANTATRNNGLTKASECFPEFSVSQADTVRRLGESQEECADKESKSNAQVEENVKAFSLEMARVHSDICVKIDDDCRDKFSRDGDILAALDCYTKVPIPARSTILEMGEDCKLKLITVDNESRTIVSLKKNCTNNANFEYLRTSDLLFEKLILTCDDAPAESSTTLSTTQSTPIPSTSQIVSTTEAASEPWETEPTTVRSRFPWNF